MCATLYLHNLKYLPTKSFYATLIQPDFCLAVRKWFQRFIPVQPNIFAENIILHYACTTWFSLHLYNLISRFGTRTTWRLLHSFNLISQFYTCTTWNLCRRYHCTLYSHNLNFITFLQYDFRVLHLHNLKSLSFW